jgi:hypothetical protein
MTFILVMFSRKVIVSHVPVYDLGGSALLYKYLTLT